jgi:hypothetical protein
VRLRIHPQQTGSVGWPVAMQKNPLRMVVLIVRKPATGGHCQPVRRLTSGAVAADNDVIDQVGLVRRQLRDGFGQWRQDLSRSIGNANVQIVGKTSRDMSDPRYFRRDEVAVAGDATCAAPPA